MDAERDVQGKWKYLDCVYQCYPLQNRTAKPAWLLEDVESVQEAMGLLEALWYFSSLYSASISLHSLEQEAVAMDTLPCPGLTVLVTAGVTALTTLLKEEIVWASQDVQKKVIIWIN